MSVRDGPIEIKADDVVEDPDFLREKPVEKIVKKRGRKTKPKGEICDYCGKEVCYYDGGLKRWVTQCGYRQTGQFDGVLGWVSQPQKFCSAECDRKFARESQEEAVKKLSKQAQARKEAKRRQREAEIKTAAKGRQPNPIYVPQDTARVKGE